MKDSCTDKAFEALRAALADAERFLATQDYATHAHVTCGYGILLFSKYGDRQRLQYVSPDGTGQLLTECSAEIRIAAGMKLAELKSKLDESHALLLSNLEASKVAAKAALADWMAPVAAER